MTLSTDPLDIKLDVNGDIDMTGGGPSLISGIPGVAQLCKMALATFQGEWFADRTSGIPYYDIPGQITEAQAILGQKFNRDKCVRAFVKELLLVPGVLKVTQMDVTFDNSVRELSVKFTVSTTFGDTVSGDTVIGV